MSTEIVQVATPFATGAGVRLGRHGLIATNAHVVEDTASIIVGSKGMNERLARVVYLDAFHDLAFLRINGTAEVRPDWAPASADAGDTVRARWQLFGQRPRHADGRIVGSRHHNHQDLLVHDARQGRTEAGAALFDREDRFVGLNVGDDPEDPTRSLALPAAAVAEELRAFLTGGGQPAARCFSCRTIVFSGMIRRAGVCPSCGSRMVHPSELRDATPSGVNATLEDIIRAADHDPLLARRGPSLWSIREGSATIQLAYHEDSGLVTGDAYLCRIPEAAPARLYAYLLRENARLQQLSFSTYGRDIILSLLIYDRYLTVATALPRFEHLFARADYYDNVLVEEYGAGWVEP